MVWGVNLRGIIMFENIINTIKALKLQNPNSSIIIAIDGGGGSGKTTLASMISAEFTGSSIVHMDDFYKLKKSRDISDLSKAPCGYEYDIDRLIANVINPLLSNKKSIYQIYNWNTDSLDNKVEIEPNNILIIEGCYSLIIQLREYYNLKIFVETDRDVRLKRGLIRDGEAALEFWNNWMQGEDKYFNDQHVKDIADFVFNGNGV